LCASAAVFRDGRVLLGSRRNPPYNQVFSLPGGLVESGETLEDAAIREVEEETGVRGKIVCFNGWREIIHRDAENRVHRHYVIASFVARWVSGEAAPSEELGRVMWADDEQMRTLPLTDGLAELLQRAKGLLGSP
jgi:ADP-ribose pyrophosphatase YjhB (NUDIX family)